MPQMLSIEFNLYWTRNIALSLTAVAKLKHQLVLHKILFIRVMLKTIPHMIFLKEKVSAWKIIKSRSTSFWGF